MSAMVARAEGRRAGRTRTVRGSDCCGCGRCYSSCRLPGSSRRGGVDAQAHREEALLHDGLRPSEAAGGELATLAAPERLARRLHRGPGARQRAHAPVGTVGADRTGCTSRGGDGPGRSSPRNKARCQGRSKNHEHHRGPLLQRRAVRRRHRGRRARVRHQRGGRARELRTRRNCSKSPCLPALTPEHIAYRLPLAQEGGGVIAVPSGDCDAGDHDECDGESRAYTTDQEVVAVACPCECQA